MNRRPVLENIAPPLPRFLAAFIDLFLLLPVNVTLMEIFIGELPKQFPPEHHRIESLLITLVTQGTYQIVFHSLFYATLGKMIMRLQVARLDGQPLMPDSVILRYLVFLVGNLLNGIGLIVSAGLILLDPNRRTLHDRVAGTVVLLKPQAGERNPWRRTRPEGERESQRTESRAEGPTPEDQNPER